jgi:hypothetical protein
MAGTLDQCFTSDAEEITIALNHVNSETWVDLVFVVCIR